MPILVLGTMDHSDSGVSAQLEAMGALRVEQARRLVDIASAEEVFPGSFPVFAASVEARQGNALGASAPPDPRPKPGRLHTCTSATFSTAQFATIML
jgi:hypothetical protein